MNSESLNCLHHVSDYEITHEMVESAIQHLKSYEYDVEKYELALIESVSGDLEESWTYQHLRIFTYSEIDVNHAISLWDEIFDVDGSLTFTDGYGNLVWRES